MPSTPLDLPCAYEHFLAFFLLVPVLAETFFPLVRCDLLSLSLLSAWHRSSLSAARRAISS
jgi:hypothetical protein